ncbi:hypothetical protein [Chryseolinea lacunae]|uniref:DUF1735 domain-containing protein n=1 Tax=Chryseolinea lacunae TaxID=2801331 RepID=A0ABS1L101_9BACT|nr:hypothetical protein [Chryseolinea lacunae]MBL0745202.1 hypothetical protein [Chryseolinea lacunae]
MRYIYSVIALFAASLVISSCVDDYTVANPPALQDAPFLRLSATGNSSVKIVAQPLNKYTAFVNYGDPVEIKVSVVNAPGIIESASVSSSIVEYGTVTLNESSFAAIKGKTSGDFTFTFTPSTILVGTADRALNLTVTVSDSQVDEKGESAALTSTLTVPLTLVNGPCLSDGLAEGTYIVSEASGNTDGGDPFSLDDLKANSGSAFSAEKVVVVVTKNRPGVYTFTEVTGGVWPVFYSTRAKPTLRVNLCDNTITGRTGFVTAGSGATARTFTLDGTLNANGTISMNWSYVRNDGNTPADPATGSYTLTKI